MGMVSEFPLFPSPIQINLILFLKNFKHIYCLIHKIDTENKKNMEKSQKISD
jgi:hypothetical protein